MRTIGIFEVKTRISEINDIVKETYEPVLITGRGVLMVRIIPIEDSEHFCDVW